MCWITPKQRPVKSVSEEMILPKPKLKVLGLNTDGYYTRDDDKSEIIWDRIRSVE